MAIQLDCFVATLLAMKVQILTNAGSSSPCLWSSDGSASGYVGQEFIPLRDKVASLSEAVRICDV